jgi:hypothetical protein
MAVYRPAAQLGQEYGAMETDRGKTRGKFTELVFDVKHDAWVIPQYAHGILLIVDSTANEGTPSLKVDIVGNETTGIHFTNKQAATAARIDTSDDGTYQLEWVVDGNGDYNENVTFSIPSGATGSDVVTVSAAGLVSTAGKTATGPVVVTITAAGDPTLTDTVTVTVVA